jgi:4-aminobutyrate aminotransferase-like enzyme
MARTWALEKHGPQKKYFVTFTGAFHGRTMGAQLAGGIPALKTWIGDLDPTFVQVPFPDGFRNTDTRFELFLETLASHGVTPAEVCGVMTESYQGGGPHFLPVDYAQKLEALCREHDILMCYDEVQAGFGRSGRMFTYEHYGVTPDLVACGKGISSSLPLSAVIGRRDVLDLYPPGSMTSTHSASPLPVAAAIANLDIIEREGLVAHGAAMGEILMPALRRIAAKYPDRLPWVTGKGLVAGIQTCHPGSKDPDGDTATAINLACFHRGLLMFAPVGTAGSCLKVAPPLCITEAALRESLDVFEDACAAVLG